jgi:zinc transporter, ZIP family
LIVGFGLHNATEGFGIVGPLRGVRPSWGWLGLAGLLGGGPTLLGILRRIHEQRVYVHHAPP